MPGNLPFSPLDPPRVPAAARYAAAVAFPALAFAVAASARGSFEPVPFALAFPAVALAGWLGGLGPGALAVLLAALLGRAFLSTSAAPEHAASATPASIVFAAAGLLVAGLAAAVRRAFLRLQAARAELGASEAGLHEASEKLRLAQRAARAGTFTYDLRTRASTFSPDFDLVYGLPPGGLAHDPGAWAARVHPDDLPRVLEQARARMARGEGFSDEFRVIWPDGTLHWIAAWTELVRPAPGERPTTLVGLNMDATERRRMEEELRLAAQRKDAFIGVLSHELRNPLAPILMSASLLARAPGDADRARRCAAVIERQARHLARMVDDLLDVTRIARQKATLVRAPMDLAEVVRVAAEDQRPLLEERGITLAVEAPAPGPWIDGDPTRVAQIVTNLLHNAGKFTPAGGRVTVTVEAGGGAASVSVADTGAGIEAGHLDRLFQPFVQLEEGLDRPRGGLGLGLALVKGLAEAHGGTATARSGGPGAGSTFTVRFPAIAAPSLAVSAAGA